ncbi:hypothetical protein CIHG_00821 [Coccidioides immitis H538.4]|uniref:Rhodopsin domain-containing protein n=3 Tax=Coccidioides immitis TaxID=5501 RepID=A0A0J8RGA1_COCIT|nr:hypothetical protein CIRG_03237 [Coccidioides immitis RMSCC 2394]KMU83039.1 hypothetical protein CIHG_00821 [Coccidioides immitis H538.4]
MSSERPSNPYIPGQSPYTDRQHTVRATAVAVSVVAAFFVCLRLLSRYIRRIKLGLDDAFIVAALVRRHGICTVPIQMLGLTEIGIYLRFNGPCSAVYIMVPWECVYCTGVVLVKLSILSFYSRIFETRTFKTAAYILSFTTISWGIAINCVSIFQCTPVHRAWDVMASGSCIDTKASFIGNAVPNICTDFCILLLPMPVIWRLHASVLHRLSIATIFILGGFVIFASIYRFITLFSMDFQDVSYTFSNPSLWSLIEVAFGIVCACLPTLRPLLSTFFDAFNSTLESTRNSTSHPTQRPRAYENGYKRNMVDQKGGEPKRNFQRINELEHQLNPDAKRRSKNHFISVARSNRGNITPFEEDVSTTSGDEVPLNAIRVKNSVEWQVAAR